MLEEQIFIEAINNLKEFARLNGGIVTKQDIMDNFSGVELEDGQLQLIYGYLQNSQIKISDVEIKENAFEKLNHKLMEKREETEQEFRETPRDSDQETDKKLLAMYMEDLKLINTSHEKLENLLKMVLDGDKKAENQLIEYFLPKIVEWIEPFKNKGVSSGDLIQEGNLILIMLLKDKCSISEKEWKTKFECMLKKKIENASNQMIEEQKSSNIIGNKVLSRVNAVNDCAVKLSKELDRKVTIEEVAENMGISTEMVKEAIEFSSNKIEDIVIEK